MLERPLGQSGPRTSALGLGCMSFAGVYGATTQTRSHRCLDAALDLGITFLDTADRYGQGLSEEVIGNYIKTRKNAFTIATKGGLVSQPTRHISNHPDYLQRALDASLKRLGVDHVALYYVHRRDHAIPIEEVAGAMGRFVEQGKIGGIGFSEISPASLRRAHAVHRVAAVQSEYSLWTRQPDLGLIDACAEIGAAFVAFSPLGRGVFGKTFPDRADFPAGDIRTNQPRFLDPNYQANKQMIAPFKTFAQDRGWSPAATAIAWTLDRAPHVFSIPGTRSATHLAELAEAATIRFTEADRAAINRILPAGFADGDRYADAQYEGVERYC